MICRQKKKKSSDNQHPVRINSTNALKQISENITVFSPSTNLWSIEKLRSKVIFDIVCEINSRRIGELVRWAIKRLRFNNYILLIDNNALKTHKLPFDLHPIITLFYKSIIPSPEVSLTNELEIRQIKQSNAVIATSEFVEKFSKSFNEMTFNIGSRMNPQTGEPFDFSWDECMNKINKIIKVIRGHNTTKSNSFSYEEEILYS